MAPAWVGSLLVPPWREEGREGGREREVKERRMKSSFITEPLLTKEKWGKAHGMIIASTGETLPLLSQYMHALSGSSPIQATYFSTHVSFILVGNRFVLSCVGLVMVGVT